MRKWLTCRVERLLKKASAGSLSLLLFSLATGGLGVWFEVKIADLSWVQMAGIRLAYNIVKYAPGGICAWINKELKTIMMGNSKHPFRRAMASGLALSAYQIPIYIVFALLAQATWNQIGTMVAFYLVNNQVFGGLYDIINDWVEARFGVRNGDMT